MVEDESSVEAFKDFTVDDAGGSKPATKPAEEEPKPKEQEKPEQPKQEPKKESQPEPSKTQDSSSSSTSTPDFGGPIHASPIARRLALERGIPLKQLKGTGPGGRIIKSDIEKYQPTSQAGTSAAPQTSAAGAQQGQGYTDVPLTGMRKTIAKRLSESMFTAPHYYLTSSINMTKTLKLRKALNDAAATSPVDGKKAYKLSVNDFIVKAVGCALQRVPEANSQWLETEGVLRLYSYVDISVYSLSRVGFLHGLLFLCISVFVPLLQ